jgi:hypothetical protein
MDCGGFGYTGSLEIWAIDFEPPFANNLVDNAFALDGHPTRELSSRSGEHPKTPQTIFLTFDTSSQNGIERS